MAVEHTRMRTLLDLLNDESAYVRIYADPAGFGYEKATYAPRPIGDLFDRMNGYSSIDSAREAAQLQLLALRSTRRSRKYTTGRKARSCIQAGSNSAHLNRTGCGYSFTITCLGTL